MHAAAPPRPPVHASARRASRVPVRRRSWLLVALLLVSVVVPGAHPAAASAWPCWPPPVVGTVVDPFREPPCPYCAGNRGIEYRTVVGGVVRAVAAGVVTWAGSVAGVRWVVVHHGRDLRVTYGRLASAHVASGDTVSAGQLLGRTGDTFHLGLRRAERYLDPAPFLGRWVSRPYLVPADGSPARPAPPSLLRCDAAERPPPTPVWPPRWDGRGAVAGGRGPR